MTVHAFRNLTALEQVPTLATTAKVARASSELRAKLRAKFSAYFLAKLRRTFIAVAEEKAE